MKLTGIFWLLVLLQRIATTEEKLYFSKGNDNMAFRLIFNVSLDTCKRECQARPKCHSINYSRLSKTCELNKMDATVAGVSPRGAWVHSEKSDWDNEMFISCNCTNHEKCLVDHGTTSCIKEECDRLITQDIFDVITIDANAKHSANCIQDINQFDRDRSFKYVPLICTADGSWRFGAQCLIAAAVMRSGTLTDPYYAWERGDNSRSDLDCLVSLDCPQSYRNNIIDRWNLLSVSEVRLSIFRNRAEAQYVVFNGTGSTHINWFKQNRITSSSWVDIMTSPSIYFSVYGIEKATPAPSARRFLLAETYSQCPNDTAWLTAVYMPQNSNGWCPYDTNNGPFPAYLFSKHDTASLCQSTNSVLADYIYILMKVDSPF